MAFRAFVGAPVGPLPPVVRLLDELAATGARVKLVKPENLHATLEFLGDVPDDAAKPIAAALDQAVAGVAPIDTRLHGVGAFPSAKRAKVVWCGVADPAPLAALAARVRERLRASGFEDDAAGGRSRRGRGRGPQDASSGKDFRAHVTLARARTDAPDEATYRFLQAHGRDELGAWRVEDVRLYRSVLAPGGPTYDALHVAKLEA